MTTAKKTAKKRRKKRVKKPPAPTIWAEWVLSIDPGESFGAALFHRGRLVVLTHNVHSLAVVASFMRMAREKAWRKTQKLVLVVESQFQGRGAAFNPATTEALTKRRHVWEVVAELQGVPFFRVPPSRWQTLLKAVPKDPKIKGGQTKERALILACRRWRGCTATFETCGDAADAALQGLWYSDQQLKDHPGRG